MNVRDSSAENSEWKKSGDFAAVMRVYQSGGIGEKVVYTHQKKDAALQEIQVCCEHPDELRVWLKINPDKYDKVEKHLAAHGFPKDYLQLRYLDVYQTQVPNAEYLANFLHALNNYDHGIDSICREIINNVSPSLHNEPTIHGWVKNGSMMNHPSETYLSCLKTSTIKRIALEQSTAEDTHLLVEVKNNNAYNVIANKVQEQGIRPTDRASRELLSTLHYPIRSKEELEKTLRALTTAENSVAAMSNSLINSYCHMNPLKPILPMHIGLGFKSVLFGREAHGPRVPFHIAPKDFFQVKDKEERPMMSANTEQNGWIKKQAFETVINDNFLKHELDYSQSLPGAVIQHVKLLGYADGDLKVLLNINKSAYKCVTDILVAKGFPKPETTDGYLGLYQMPIPNTQYLRDFLAAAACADPAVNLIAPEIIRTATPHSKEEPTLQGWVKENDFNYLRKENRLLRREEYHSSLPTSKITDLKLLGYIDGEITFSIQCHKNEFASVVAALIAAGFPGPDHLNLCISTCRPVIKSEADLKRALTAISSIEKSVTFVADNILASYRQAAELGSMYARPFMMFPGNDFSNHDTSYDLSIYDALTKFKKLKEMPTIDPTPSDDDRFKFPTIRHY